MTNPAAVIASDFGSLREVHDDDGILVAERDADGFAEGQRRLIHNEPGERAPGPRSRPRDHAD